EPGNDQARGALLHGEKRVLGRGRAAVLAYPAGRRFERRNEGIRLLEHLVWHSSRGQLSRPLRNETRHSRAHRRRPKRAVKRQIRLRHLRGSREAPFIGGSVTAERANVIERPWLAAHYPVSTGEVGVGGVLSLRVEYRFVKPGRQNIDEIDIAGEFAVLLARHSGRNEDSQVAYGLVDRVDDRLPMGADLVDILVKVENPCQSLLGRGNVVTLRAEHDDRRAYVPEVDCGAIRGSNPTRCEIVADEQLVDDELHFLGVEGDVAPPPALEFQIARSLGVDLSV